MPPHDGQARRLAAALAGLVGGAVGGLILAAAPGSAASLAVVPVLAVIGGCCGAAGGAGVGAGLSVAESIARSRRALALICGAALGGGVAGYIAQWLGRWSLAALVGVNIDIGGGLEGLAIGGAAGLGYSLATSHSEGGLAAPRGRRRLIVAGATAASCGAAALALALAGRPLVGGTIHFIADASVGSQVTLTSLGRFIGESDFGPLTAALIATGEGALFGLGLALGLARRSLNPLRAHALRRGKPYEPYQSTTEPSSASYRGRYGLGSPTCACSLFSSIVMPRPGSVSSGRCPFLIGGNGLASRSAYSLSPRS